MRKAETSEQNQSTFPVNEMDREVVLNELWKILASPPFQNSKRYTAVLRYIVEQTLEGNGASLKERTIGIEIFDRAPDYDTYSDHVVRSAFSEVRKRLALYYQGITQVEIKIELLPGCYTPNFRIPSDSIPQTVQVVNEESSTPHQTEVPPLPDVTSALVISHRRPLWRRRPVWLATAFLLMGLCIAAKLIYWKQPLDRFWQPIFSAHAPVLLCVGNLAGGKELLGSESSVDPALTIGDFHQTNTELVSIHDAITTAKIAALMQTKKKDYRILSQSDTNFDDLQNGPVILIGLMNNPWAKRLLPQERFTVERPIPTQLIIRDREHPSNSSWSVDYTVPYLDFTHDYAIVWRIVDPKTEKVVVCVAGLTVFGTYAAGEFLTSNDELRKLEAVAPPGWEKKNMELVLTTTVIRGKSGPATIVAAHFW